MTKKLLVTCFVLFSFFVEVCNPSTAFIRVSPRINSGAKMVVADDRDGLTELLQKLENPTDHSKEDSKPTKKKSDLLSSVHVHHAVEPGGPFLPVPLHKTFSDTPIERLSNQYDPATLYRPPILFTQLFA